MNGNPADIEGNFATSSFSRARHRALFLDVVFRKVVYAQRSVPPLLLGLNLRAPKAKPAILASFAQLRSLAATKDAGRFQSGRSVHSENIVA